MADIATKEINGFYSRYATKEDITLAEAKRRISTADIAEYAKKAEKYVPDKDLSDKANEEMRLYNAMMSINRLEMLKSNIGLGMVEGFDELDKAMQEHLTEAAEAEFVRQAGILGGTVRDPRAAARTIVNSSFHNATFSERIWMHQDMLRSELDKLLQEGLIKGESSLKLAQHLKKAFGASQRDAERLMRTEMSRVYTEAQKESYEDAGYEDYTYIALGDACEICAPLDGKHFKVKQMRVGENAPPMHPNCRCSTAPWMEREEFKRWLDDYSEDDFADLTDKNLMKHINSLENEKERVKIKYSGDESKQALKNLDERIEKLYKANGYAKLPNTENGIYVKIISGEHSIDDDLKNTNPNKYRNNCQRCVIAYEARRRSFNVTALPKPTDPDDRLPKRNDPNGWPSVFKGGQLVPIGKPDAGSLLKAINNQMELWGDGSRAIVRVKIRGGSGHVIIAENSNQGVRIICPQTNNKDYTKRFSTIETMATEIMRIDNLDFTDRILECCEGV